ncbi:MAG TPA: hypothetical protein VJH87_16215 [Vicinamibacteria bacterium]|nr:hypothetical protein [Vicinamibacteria bacterium]
MQSNVVKAPTAMVILPCPACGRAVKVLGRVQRVLCACGQVLMEIGREKSPPKAASTASTEVLKAG